MRNPSAPSEANRAIDDDIEAGTANANAITITNINTPEHETIHKSIQTKSFINHIKYIVELKSDTVFSTWYNDKGKPINNYTFQQLWDEAGHCAHLLRNKWGVKKDDRVVLCYDFGLHFFAMFLGCLRAGVTAVLVYPPGPPLVKSLTKMNKVIEDCAPALILTQTSINLLRAADRANPASKSRAMWPSGVKYQVTDRIIRHDPFITNKNSNSNSNPKQAKKGFLSSLISGRSSSSPSPSFDEPNIEGSDLAFLQYTSGSTGNPKGVMVTHDALRANIELFHSSFLTCFEKGANEMQILERFTTFSWLPQYHDMGLIQMVIVPLASNSRVHMISPVTFIRNPLLWVDLMSQHKCHFSAAPDFAYRLVVRKFNEANKQANRKANSIPNLDLASVLHLQNAAEPIRLDTKKEFADVFCPYGLRKDWFLAAYGLAENVVGTCYNHDFYLSTVREGEDLHPFVAIAERSNLHSSIDIIIVDPDTCVQRPDNVTGEIWVAGASVTAGYYNQPKLTAETFQATLQGDASSDADSKMYLRTGDYGFYQDDYLYICGRKKDIIIVNGVNYYPQDIEQAVEEASSAVRPGCVAAFSSDDSGNDGQLEIVFEIRASRAEDAGSVSREVRKAVIEHIGLTPATIAAVKERTISKTTSGKIQRRQNRQRLHDGAQKVVLDVIEKSHFFSTHDTNLASQSKRLSSRKSIIEDFDIRDMDFYELVKRCIGSDVKAEDTWKDVGLSSLMELELRQSLSTRYSATLPPNCFDLFPMVGDLKTVLEATAGKPLPRNLSTLRRLATIPNEKPLSRLATTLIQLVGVLAILFIFALPVVPAYEIGKFLANNDHTRVVFFIDLTPYVWVFYPLIIPVWVASFTLEIILVKWIVIGRYREGHTNQASLYFLRWWFVDRLLHLWEHFVSRFIVGTPLMTLFCYLMGANVHRSSNIDATVREFDLVKIGSHATVSEPIRCRMFGPLRDDSQGPSLRFRKIQVGSDTTIKGMLCPGVKVGSNCQVQRISVLAEGAQAPSNITISGNPGFIDATGAANILDGEGSGREPPDASAKHRISRSRWILLGTLKLAWLVFELHFAFACFLVIDIQVGSELPSWRYAKLLYRLLMIGLVSSFFVVSTIILKWAMIGKKRPGPARMGVLSEFADWACDFHYSLGGATLYGLTFNSPVWNLILMASGMDIDMRSKIAADSFCPSKLDLVAVNGSFVSKASFDIEQNGEYKPIRIEDSSIGAMVAYRPGVIIRRTLVSPATTITNDLIHDHDDPRNKRPTSWEFLQTTFITTLLYAIMFLVVAASFIPAFELWMYAIKPQTPLAAVPTLVIGIIVQTIIWLIILRIVEFITLAGGRQRSEPWCVPLYMVYQSLCYSIHIWSFVSTLWGTPMMNAVLRFQGADIQGRLLYFGFRVYEPSLVTFAGGTVIDEANISGHYGVFSTLTLGECFADGVMHQQAFVLARREPTQPGGSLIEHRPGKMVGDDQAPCTEQLQSPSILVLVEEGRRSTDPGAALDRCTMQDLDTTARS